jgi:hypothetical protein
MATVSCPSCGRALEVEDAYRDWTVRCPHCEHEFVPAEVAPADGGMAMDSLEDRPRRRRRRDDEYDDDDDRPRRRRRRREDDSDDYDDDYERPRRRRRYSRAEAEQIVAAPAMWLEICGWGGALLTVGACLIMVAVGMELMNNPPAGANRNNEPGEFWLFMSCCMGILGLPYSVAMAIGARKMRTLSSRAWAMTASILGIAAFVIWGVCGMIQAGIGIWALVAMSNPAVQDAFNNSAHSSRNDWDD